MEAQQETAKPAAGTPAYVLATVHRHQASETFLQQQAAACPGQLHWLTGGYRPSVTDSGQMVASTAWPLGKRRWQRAIRGWLKAHKPRAVLAAYGPVGVELAPPCIASGIPLVVHFHGFDATRKDVLRRYARAYRRWLPQVAGVVAVSEPMAWQLQQLGALPQRMRVLPCGAAAHAFAQAAATPAHTSPPHALFVGRLTPKKGLLAMLDAFARVWSACPSARLTLAGEGPLLPTIRQKMQHAPWAHAVTLLGATPHDLVPKLMAKHRLVVLAASPTPKGDQEGSPVILAEAGAAARPAISTYSAGIPALIRHGETGLLAEVGDAQALTAHWLQLLQNEQLAEQLGQAAQAHIRAHYDAAKQAQKLWQQVDAWAATWKAKKP